MFTQINGQPTAGLAAISTSAPAITLEAPQGIASDRVTLRGTVDPDGTPAALSFQITTRSGDYFDPITMQATPSLAEGSTSTTVSAQVNGLRPGMLYFYRLVAVNSAGPTASIERALITSGQRALLPIAAR